MTAHRPDRAIRRLLDALEAELIQASDEEIQAAVAETGMSAKALSAEAGILTVLKTASPLEGEVGDAEHRRVGGMPQPSRRNRRDGDSTPHPDPGAERPVCASQSAASGGGSDLPLKGGGD